MILFLKYTAYLMVLIERHDLLYTDDTQMNGLCQLQSRVSSCVSDVALWMRANCLQLNIEKIRAAPVYRYTGRFSAIPANTGSAGMKGAGFGIQHITHKRQKSER